MIMQSARKQPFDYIVVYRLDRISRNVGDFATLIEELNGAEYRIRLHKGTVRHLHTNGQGYDEYCSRFRSA